MSDKAERLATRDKLTKKKGRLQLGAQPFDFFVFSHRTVERSYRLLQAIINLGGRNLLEGIKISEKKKTTIRLQTVITLKEKLVSILKRSPEPVIALSAIFEALGYSGLTGIGWGILGGFVVSVAMELGYDVRQISGRYILFRSSKRR